jgi:hypothetical protein
VPAALNLALMALPAVTDATDASIASGIDTVK